MTSDEEALNKRRLDLEALELEIRDRESKARIDAERRSVWFTSPLILAFIGLVGTGVGATLQGFWNAKLERQKFESSLIEKALANPDRNEVANTLRFLVEAGLVNGLNTANITALASKPKELPTFMGAAFANRLITVREAKAALSRLGFYKGTVDDTSDEGLRRAVADFQTSSGLLPDGYLGPLTLAKLREAAPELSKSGQ
jgi:hypothetical protein